MDEDVWNEELTNENRIDKFELMRMGMLTLEMVIMGMKLRIVRTEIFLRKIDFH